MAAVESPARPRHFLSLREIDSEVLRHLIRRSCTHAGQRGASPDRPLAGRVVATHFRKTSTRTRTAFSTAAFHLGANVLALGPTDLQENTGETTGDTGRILGLMVDALVVRTAGPDAELRLYAEHGRIPVVNAMSASEHPTQAVTDLATMQNHFGRVDGLRVLYIGEGNNTAAALALAFGHLRNAELHLRTPPGYGVQPEILDAACHLAAAGGGKIEEQHTMAELPADVDVVYTTRWQTTGTEKPTADWRSIFAPYRVTRAVMDHCRDAVLLHDLPAHRGEEVSAEVLDGPRSLAFEQAEFKLHGAKAVLEWALVDDSGTRSR